MIKVNILWTALSCIYFTFQFSLLQADIFCVYGMFIVYFSLLARSDEVETDRFTSRTSSLNKNGLVHFCVTEDLVDIHCLTYANTFLDTDIFKF